MSLDKQNSKTQNYSFNPYYHKHHFLRYVFGVVILTSLSFFAGWSISVVGNSDNTSVLSTSNMTANSFNAKASFNEGVEFAKKRLEERGIFNSSSPLFFVVAKVNSVDDNNIKISFSASKIDILEEGNVEKTIVIPNDVKIEQKIPKDLNEIKKEFDDFQKKYQEYKNNSDQSALDNLSEPMPYTIKNIAVSDLKEGDRLLVKTNEDLKKLDKLNAKSVVLFSSN